MYEPYTERLTATDKVNFELAFGSAFQNGSPFEQPYKAFLAAIIGADMLIDAAFGQVTLINRQIQYPGVWVNEFSIGVQEACQSMFSGSQDVQSNLVINMIMQLVVYCHDKVKVYDDGSTEFDFFRHIRHACAHGNKFIFYSRTTGLPARWRGAEINRGSQGYTAILGLVGIPDILLLLKDIENKLPPYAFNISLS